MASTLADYGLIVRGGETSRTVTMTDDNGWAGGSDSWTWKLLIAPKATRATLALGLESASATISGDSDEYMTLVFDFTAANTTALSPGNYYVEVEGAEGDETEHYYEGTDVNPIHGDLTVRDPEGGG